MLSILDSVLDSEALSGRGLRDEADDSFDILEGVSVGLLGVASVLDAVEDSCGELFVNARLTRQFKRFG